MEQVGMSNKRSKANGGFPERDRLWPGAVLGTIAHSFWVAANPDFANEQSWDKSNYSVQDSQGTRGTVTFAGDDVVAAFRDENSPRSPFRSGLQYDLRAYFEGIPDGLYALAEKEALQYVLDEYEGKTVPVITAAFWGEGDRLTAAEPWKDVVANGAHLLNTQLMDPDEAMEEWVSAYELTGEQAGLMRSLFDRKTKDPQGTITLNDDEVAVLTAGGNDGETEARELLAGIGIDWPSGRGRGRKSS
jgi:hypothetical protein